MKNKKRIATMVMTGLILCSFLSTIAEAEEKGIEITYNGVPIEEAIGTASEMFADAVEENVGTAIHQFPYTREWIKSMKKHGYHVYILSNYGSWTYQCTREDALNFLEDVDGALFSYEVKLIKPDPEIYQTLFERFHLVSEECVFLDDLEANIEGAKNAGMHGIVFKGQEDAVKQLKEAYHVEC